MHERIRTYLFLFQFIANQLFLVLDHIKPLLGGSRSLGLRDIQGGLIDHIVGQTCQSSLKSLCGGVGDRVQVPWDTIRDCKGARQDEQTAWDLLVLIMQECKSACVF